MTTRNSFFAISASFYTNTGLCLALPFAPAQLEGWEFSSAIFVFYNMVIFIVIAVCQCVIYQTAKSTSRIIPAKAEENSHPSSCAGANGSAKHKPVFV
jgi:hypothetical protein